jgi:hypothetical protein
MNFDDNALFRHPDIVALRDLDVHARTSGLYLIRCGMVESSPRRRFLSSS